MTDTKGKKWVKPEIRDLDIAGGCEPWEGKTQASKCKPKGKKTFPTQAPKPCKPNKKRGRKPKFS